MNIEMIPQKNQANAIIHRRSTDSSNLMCQWNVPKLYKYFTYGIWPSIYQAISSYRFGVVLSVLSQGRTTYPLARLTISNHSGYRVTIGGNN